MRDSIAAIYRRNAQIALYHAHQAMAHADRSRLEGCLESAARYSNNAARYRQAYIARMNGSRLHSIA